MTEYIGYAASAIILVSLIMSSAKKLRMINLIGGILFTVYGFLIKSYPVAIMNLAISFVNIYYLYKMFITSDYFKLLSIDKQSTYLKYFFNYYKQDIETFFPNTDIDVDASEVSFYILRNVVPAGFFVANKVDKETLRVDFDYVVPMYRDFQMGEYIYKKKKSVFTDKGYKYLITYTNNDKHERYLKKMGFKEITSDDTRKCYQIKLV